MSQYAKVPRSRISPIVFGGGTGCGGDFWSDSWHDVKNTVFCFAWVDGAGACGFLLSVFQTEAVVNYDSVFGGNSFNVFSDERRISR